MAFKKLTPEEVTALEQRAQEQARWQQDQMQIHPRSGRKPTWKRGASPGKTRSKY